MKKYALLLLLVYPLITWAQADDLYFVPKKEKTVLVVKSADEVYFVGDNDVVVESYVDDDEEYYSDDLYDVDNDYQFSTRIIRFHSPRRTLYGNLYWDLYYNSGINDLYVYDNGYSINIYPTYSYVDDYYMWMNSWNWASYGYYPSWFYRPYYSILYLHQYHQCITHPLHHQEAIYHQYPLHQLHSYVKVFQ